MRGEPVVTTNSGRRVPFAAGVLAGAAAVLLSALLINAVDALDVLVRPLLVPDSPDGADAIVVPGAGVIGASCVLNTAAIRRTMLAVHVYEQGRAPLVVFAGGKPEHSPCTVGDVMAALAEQLGVPREAILVESRSSSTWENALFTWDLLQPRGVHRILIVTDALHVPRCEGAFRKVGFEIGSVSVPVVQVSPSNLAMLRMAAHEYLGLIYYRMRGYS